MKELFYEEDVELLENGDLVISTMDLHVMEGALIKAGHVFEFKEEYLPYISSPLLKPNQKQIIEFSLNKELTRIKDDILSYYPKTELKFVLTSYIDALLKSKSTSL